MHVSEFDYELPPDRIAQRPVEPRDSARLLVDTGAVDYAHLSVRDLPDLVAPGDLFVVNDTRVLRARLNLHRSSGGLVEVLLLEPIDDESRRWRALVRPGGRLRDGEILRHRLSSKDVVFHSREDRGDTFEVELIHHGDVLSFLDSCGDVPLPPYLIDGTVAPDRYQTVYARRAASTAAPTAGLHFTKELIKRIEDKGGRFASVELVVGVDTFRPIQTEDPRDHPIHSEFYSVPQETMDLVEKAGRVIAVGTTAVRSLESAATFGELTGRTELFIHGDYSWKVVDVMMTNFHMPRTTLLMLVDSFTGGRWRKMYDVALAGNYRFLSFGDAMFAVRSARPT